MPDCSCEVDFSHGEPYILYCPLHNAAENMLQALKKIAELVMEAIDGLEPTSS